MKNVTIISDGTAQGTQVRIDDKFMKGITRIDILPISPKGKIEAQITIDVAALKLQVKDADIFCTDVVMAERIKLALLDGQGA